jgi:hypothetical protein
MLRSPSVKRDVRSCVSAAIPLALALVLSGAGCHGRDDAANRAAVANLDQALNPTFLVAALRKLGGAHFHGTTRMSVTAAATAANEAGWDTVTTTTDVWLDRGGNYRIVEANDQDGGREIVLFGHDLNVALRYGKMIRRKAQDPEPERLLEEALGGPWSGWEVASPYAIIKHTPVDVGGGRKGEEYRVSKSTRRHRKAVLTPQGIQHWRSNAAVLELNGQMTVDNASSALLKSDFVVVFAAQRTPEGHFNDRASAPGEAVVGTVDVQTVIDDIGVTGTIQMPPAEDLSLRQRIVPEQKELLGGLSASAGGGAKDGKPSP